MSLEMQTLIRLDKLYSGITSFLGKEPKDLTEGVQYLVSDCKLFDTLVSGEPFVLFNDRVTIVGNNAFMSHTNLQGADLPNVTTLKAGAFQGCSNLSWLNAPLLTTMEFDEEAYIGPLGSTGLLSIDFPRLSELCVQAFSYNTLLKQVSLPLVTHLPANSFQACKALSEFDFSKIVYVGNSAFYSSGLTTVESDSIQELGSSAFAYSEALTTVYLPNTTTSGTGPFNACKLLSTLNAPKLGAIPNSFCFNAAKLTYFDAPVATSIGTNAFARSGLKTLVLRSPTLCSLSSTNAFTNTSANIYVPDELVSEYKGATNWTSLASRILPISDLEG